MEWQHECLAGVGPLAYCKHLCAVLYAVHDITVNGDIKLETCQYPENWILSLVKNILVLLLT